MKVNYKITKSKKGKYQLVVDEQIIKLCRTDIVMETDRKELLEKIANELNPEEYKLEEGDILGQYIPDYFLLSKKLMSEMDDSQGLFGDDRFHWMISSDPFFHLMPGPESIEQRNHIDFALQQLEKMGGFHLDLPLLMAANDEQMEEYRNNEDYYIDVKTAGIIRDLFIKLDHARKGVFYQLWSATGWNVFIPLLWLNDLCSDEEFCRGVAGTQALIPAFGDISNKDYEEVLERDRLLLGDCRAFIAYF